MATVNDGIISGNADVSQEMCYMLRDQICELLNCVVHELQRSIFSFPNFFVKEKQCIV